MKIENDLGYIEGMWIGKRMPLYIEKTEYKTIEGAIKAKQILVEKFETEFGYSRVMAVDKFDYNYSYNVGILDALYIIKNQ
jgi:hypothetical protein